MTARDHHMGYSIPLEGCGTVRDATDGCRTLVVAATDLEARPVLESLLRPRRFAVATKTLYVGDFAETSGSTAGSVGQRVALMVSGCDKVNTAVALTCLLQAMAVPPALVIQTGIGGAFAGDDTEQDVRPGDVVIATQEAYSDTGSSSPCGWIAATELDIPIAEVGGVELGGVFPVEPRLVEWARGVLAAAGFSGASAGEETRSEPAVWQGPCVTSSTVTGTDDEASALAARWGALAESMEGAAAAHVCALYGAPFLEVRGMSNLVGDRDRSSWLIEEAVEAAGRAAVALVAAVAPEDGE